MKALTTLSLVIATSLASTGCFTTWVGLRAAGKPGAWDENVREENVPMPGVSERLVLKLPVAQQTFQLECTSRQDATDAVYHTAYRYGSAWKKSTAIMFLAEAAVGAIGLLTYDKEKPGGAILGGYFAIDAIGTGVLFFAPRKEINRRDEKPVTTTIRSDCPDGLVIDIAGDSFPVDATGRIGELGEAAFDAWLEASQPAAPAPMSTQPQAGPYVPPAYGAPVTQTAPVSAMAVTQPAAPVAPLLLSFGGKTQELGVGAIDRCVAYHARHPEAPPCSSTTSIVIAMFEVPVGTFGTIAAN